MLSGEELIKFLTKVLSLLNYSTLHIANIVNKKGDDNFYNIID